MSDGRIPATLALYAGHVGELDATLSTLTRTRAWAIPGDKFPDVAKHEPGPDMLLVATSSIPGGTVYLIVGVLHRARLSEGRRRVDFDALERFVVPVVVSTARGTLNTRLGFEKFWSASEIYWCPVDAVERCRLELERMLSFQET
jgi:hypothetical protein